jgi:hypothetical protein
MLAAFALAAAAPDVDPYAVFSRARSRWNAQAYPAFLTYSVSVSGTDGARIVRNTYESSDDTGANRINVHATSAEEAANPYVPRGVIFRTKITIGYAGKQPLGAAPTVDGGPAVVKATKVVPISRRQQFDLLGVPVLSPTYSFGLESSQNLAPSTNVESLTPTSALRTIASVTAVRRDYDIRFEGIDTVDGDACYHLALSPLRDPAAFRLRQLWIDESAYTTRQALVQGNFTEGPGPKIPWLIRFAVRDGLMYIADETALTPVRYLGRTYTNTTVAFNNVSPAAAPNVTWMLSLFQTSGDVLEEPER